ncbi:MAG: hypothetical protein C5B48_09755 [Candidatus Rokuibacteriota bacterium]|nr:MAG: hypothetical protein C5B48_09755 [Candidatus Rokubacteria bacterium]
MSQFFPRKTTEIRIREPRAFRRLSYSLIQMALVTGVVVRTYRVLILTHGANNWLYIGATFALGAIFFLGMVTAHLANFPLHQYLWRAPAFAGIEVAAEMVTSALLISLGYEANGTVRAHWDDWIGMGVNALLIRGIAILVWSAILAGAVQLVRRTVVHEDEDANSVTAP